MWCLAAAYCRQSPGWCICAMMNRLRGAVLNRLRRWLARRLVGRAIVRRARVRALAVLMVTAVAALVVAVVSHLAWPPVVLGILCTLPALYLAWLAVPGVVSTPETAAAEMPARGRPAAEWDLRRLGVHAAISVPGVADEVPPEYVPRDVDGGEFGVRAQVAAAARRGGFVLLVGGSSVGKTRCAAEAVTALLPDWRLVHPGEPSQVAALAAAPARRMVVWLDELQHYLDGPGGLTAAVVRALVNPPHPAVVIGTLWPDLYTGYTAVPAPGGADPHARERQLLDLAAVVRIGPAFTPAEQARARAAAARDARLKVALAAAGYGLTQTLAAAPQLVARWYDAQAADPYAWAVLTAALDAARLGVRSPLGDDFLHAAAPGYCTSQQQAEAPRNWFEQALDYATGTVLGAAAALTPAGVGMGQVAGYAAADYLVQHATRERRGARMPASTWEAALSHLHDPADTTRLADSAANRLLYCYAIPLYRHAADAGDRAAAYRLAGLLAQRGDLDEAEQILRARADAGDEHAAGQLTDLLTDRGDPDEAEQILRARADAGDEHAAWRLADLLTDRGDLDGLRARADARDEHAARRLTDLLVDRGDLDWVRARADAGDEHADRRLPQLLAQRGDLDGLRARADAGDGNAAGWLAGLLYDRGDLDGLRARARRRRRERRCMAGWAVGPARQPGRVARLRGRRRRERRRVAGWAAVRPRRPGRVARPGRRRRRARRRAADRSADRPRRPGRGRTDTARPRRRRRRARRRAADRSADRPRRPGRGRTGAARPRRRRRRARRLAAGRAAGAARRPGRGRTGTARPRRRRRRERRLAAARAADPAGPG